MHVRNALERTHLFSTMRKSKLPGRNARPTRIPTAPRPTPSKRCSYCRQKKIALDKRHCAQIFSPLRSKLAFLWFLGCVPVQIPLLILPSTFFLFLYFGAGNMAQDQLFARFQRADVGDAWERNESCAGHILSIETRNVTNRVRVAH